MSVLPKRNADKWSDELIAFMVDGDIRVDPDVHQEFGMLDSKKFGWLLRMQRPTPRYEWLADEYPTKTGHAYCVAREPDPVDAMPEFVNNIMAVIVLAASQGTTKDQAAAAQTTALTRLIVGVGVGILLLGMFLVVPFFRAPVVPPGGEQPNAKLTSVSREVARPADWGQLLVPANDAGKSGAVGQAAKPTD